MAKNDIPLPTGGLPDITKANFYDQKPEDQEKLLSSLEDSQKALEQRYANPNWFNVAAGFLKPQLGGFGASLGSANEAFGENLEKQRANELTVANQRAQVGLMRNQMAQTARANAEAKSASEKGGITPGQQSNISMLGGMTPGDATQQQFTNESNLRREVLANIQSGLSEAEIMAKLGPGAKPFIDEAAKNRPSIPGFSAAAPSAEMPNSTVPPESGMSQEQWNATPITAKNAFSASYAETNKNIAAKTMAEYKDKAETAQPKIDLYQSTRELATSPGMDKVFNLLGDNDIVSLAGTALNEGRISDRLANINNILTQANINDPDLRSRVSRLIKLINENKSMQGNSRTTDQATALRGASNPSLDNPQTAFVALTDALAHSESRNRDLFRLVNSKKPNGEKYNPSTLINEPAYDDYSKDFTRTHTGILTGKPGNQVPSFYSPGFLQSTQGSPPTQARSNAASGSGNAAAPIRKAPDGWKKESDGSFTKIK